MAVALSWQNPFCLRMDYPKRGSPVAFTAATNR